MGYVPGLVSRLTPASANHVLWLASKVNSISCPSQVPESVRVTFGVVTRKSTGLPLTRRVGWLRTVQCATAEWMAVGAELDAASETSANAANATSATE